jgi:hypothetical protein
LGLNKVQPSGQISNALVYFHPHSRRGHLLKRACPSRSPRSKHAIDYPRRLDDRRRADEYGAAEFITKPVDFEMLKERLRQLPGGA